MVWKGVGVNFYVLRHSRVDINQAKWVFCNISETFSQKSLQVSKKRRTFALAFENKLTC